MKSFESISDVALLGSPNVHPLIGRTDTAKAGEAASITKLISLQLPPVPSPFRNLPY